MPSVQLLKNKSSEYNTTHGRGVDVQYIHIFESINVWKCTLTVQNRTLDIVYDNQQTLNDVNSVEVEEQELIILTMSYWY